MLLPIKYSFRTRKLYNARSAISLFLFLFIRLSYLNSCKQDQNRVHFFNFFHHTFNSILSGILDWCFHQWWSKLPLSSLFQSIWNLCFPLSSKALLNLDQTLILQLKHYSIARLTKALKLIFN
jgi:hypothetical protein